MNVDIFTLCDAATSDGGKLNILGAFDTIFAATFPIIHPHCAIALRVRFRPSERGDHELGIDFVDEDGRSLLPPLRIGMNVGVSEGERFATIAMAVNIQQLNFPRPGEYAVNLTINRDEKASFQLLVKQVSSQP